MAAQQGLGAILDPNKLRRGLGDALMAIGAIGLGQDPFAVMQQNRQSRSDEEQRGLENKRYDQEFDFKKQQFGLRQQQEERLLQQQMMHQQEDHERRKAASEQSKVVAAALFPKEAADVAQTAQMMQAAQQSPQQGLTGIMGAPPQQAQPPAGTPPIPDLKPMGAAEEQALQGADLGSEDWPNLQILGPAPDGKGYRVRDKKTGRTGTWQP